MKINIIGAGPTGLFFALYLKNKKPSCDITIYEKRPRNATAGWGILFQDNAKVLLQSASAKLAEQLQPKFCPVTDRAIFFKEHTFSYPQPYHDTIACQDLTMALRDACEEVGVKVEYGVEIKPSELPQYRDCDLLIGADGVQSTLRQHWQQHFNVAVTHGINHYIWLAANKNLNGFRLILDNTDFGPIAAHTFPYGPERSNLIVELPDHSWQAGGFDHNVDAQGGINQQGLARLKGVLGKFLDHADLLSKGSRWKKFPQLNCQTWSFENVLLLGDAAHASFFSKGLNTQVAFEDGAMLAELLSAEDVVSDKLLGKFFRKRKGRVNAYQKGTALKNRFFEDLDAIIELPPSSLSMLIQD